MEEIHRAKDKYGADNPEIHIAYMLLRSGLDDLEKLPESLNTIWHRKEYQQLMHEFRSAKGPAVCQNCLKKHVT